MDIYKDIEKRTNGEIYMGIVGPVRSGKSTFIKRFMELLVIPKIEDEHSKKRALDELPQSAAGKTIMTTEPKFIPKNAAQIVIDDVSLKLRMIDCVGYMINGAQGHEEDGRERLVKTPWFDYEIPFKEAAEIGTKKVIYDHSTVGIVVSCDGTITDIERDSYIEAESRCVRELKELGKPFVMVLNTVSPMDKRTVELANELSQKYKVAVIPVNCESLKKSDINNIFEKLLLQFPITSVNFNIPKWVETLEYSDEIKQSIVSYAGKIFEGFCYMRDVLEFVYEQGKYIENCTIKSINMATGEIDIDINVSEEYYYKMLSQLFGSDIKNDYDFLKEVKELVRTKELCKKLMVALDETKTSGYSYVAPGNEEIVLDEPEVIKSGNKYGVKLKAKAPSIHLIKANITTEIAPIVGNLDQANDLMEYIDSDSLEEGDIWGVNIFGKTVKQLVEDGMMAKINKINNESRQKLQDTMEKIVNDSNGGMVCIII